MSGAADIAAPEFLLPQEEKLVWEQEVAPWRERVWKFARRLADIEPEMSEHLLKRWEALTERRVALVFAGHFKSGKSSTVNAALMRNLLPVDSLPETGAMCLLKSGEIEQAFVFENKTKREIPCVTTAIQKEISLISDRGERRVSVNAVDRLEITLPDCAIPHNVLWVDSPGINDTVEMNACALRAARRSDILMWVLSSRTPLSGPEMSFISEHLTLNGPNSVVFLLNCFLREDSTEAWEAFQGREIPAIMTKVREFAPDIGFESYVPPLVAFSARALCNHYQGGFGREELSAIMGRMDHPARPYLLRVRCFRLGTVLQRLADKMEDWLETERRKSEADRLEAERRKQESYAREQQFGAEIGRALGRWQTTCIPTLSGAGSAFADTITAANLDRTGLHAATLMSVLNNAGQPAFQKLVMDCAAIARQHCMRPMDPVQIGMLQKLLAPPAVPVFVPDTRFQSAPNRSAAPKMRIADMSFAQMAAALGAGIDQAISQLDGNGAKGAQDAAATQANIRAATQTVVAALPAKCRQAVEFIVRTAASLAVPEPDPSPLLQTCSELLTLARQLAQEGETIGKRRSLT